MTPLHDKTKDNIQLFLDTLKIHNKDIDACFNDALAVSHLMALVDRHIEAQIVQAVREKTTTKDALIVQQKKYIRELEAQLNQEDES